MWLGCAQGGGVVSMGYGEVTFKGGTITNTKATVRTRRDAHVECCAVACGYWMPHVARTTLRCVRRALHGDAGLDGPFELYGVCRGSHAALWIGTGSLRHIACRRTLCCIACFGALLRTVRCFGASVCGPAWVRMQ